MTPTAPAGRLPRGGLLSGAVAGAVSALVFTAVHDLLISDIWATLPLMLGAGAACGLSLGWTYHLLVARPALGSWVRYNLLFVALFVGLGAVSVWVFEPVTTMAEVIAANEPPTELFGQAMPMTAAFTLGMAGLVYLRYGRGPRQFAAILGTCTLLVLLLGLNVSAIGLVAIPRGSAHLIAEMFALIGMLGGVYAAVFVGLERRRFWGPLAVLLLAVAVGGPAEAQPVAIVDVSVVDVAAGAVVPGQTVVVDGDRIVAVGPSAAVAVPEGAAVVDGTGRFLIPGLWDMHVHSSSDRITRETMLPLYIANGVTGVRDMKGDCFAPCDEISSTVEEVNGWRRDIARGALVGPRIVAGSDLLNGPPPGDSSSVERPATEAEGRALAHLLVARGVDFAKPYSMLPRDAYFGLADEAETLGLPLAGHVPLEVWPSEAIAAGQRSIEHQLGLVEECSTRREELVPQLLANIQSGAEDMLAPLSGMVESHSPEACAALFEQMVEAGTWSVPTLVVQRWVVLDPVDPRLRYLAPEERTYWDETLARQAEIWPEDPRFEALHHELTVAMHRAGVQILAGSDAGAPGAFAGFGLHDELAWLVRIGMTPAEALRAATLGPAEYLEATDSLGTVAPGKVADLVLLDANPLDDIAHTQRIRAVVARGRLFGRAELDALLAGVARAAAASPAPDEPSPVD